MVFLVLIPLKQTPEEVSQSNVNSLSLCFCSTKSRHSGQQTLSACSLHMTRLWKMELKNSPSCPLHHSGLKWIFVLMGLMKLGLLCGARLSSSAGRA